MYLFLFINNIENNKSNNYILPYLDFLEKFIFFVQAVKDSFSRTVFNSN